MGKTSHRKVKHRSYNADINDNNGHYRNHNHISSRQTNSYHKTDSSTSSSRCAQETFRTLLKTIAHYIGYTVLFLLFFQLILPGYIEFFYRFAKDIVNQVTFEDVAGAKKNSALTFPQGSDYPAVSQSIFQESDDKYEDLPKELRDFQPSVLNTFQPKEITVDGRLIVPLEIVPTKPNNGSVRVYIYENFLSTRECNGLMGAHKKHVNDRGTYQPLMCFDGLHTLRQHLHDNHKSHINVSNKDFIEGTLCVNESFSSQLQSWMNDTWSYSTAFYPGENSFSHAFTTRVHEATGLLPDHGGKFQITSYPQGIGYKTHTDCILNGNENRDRFATILTYLQDVKRGGHTEFPELGISIKPKAGRAVVWNNMDSSGSCDPVSVHNAQTVQQGHKFILQRWYYYENFYALGKRMREPELPVRNELQPRVSCDEYEHGSCRWYDEWNYDHLIEYSSVKHSLH